MFFITFMLLATLANLDAKHEAKANDENLRSRAILEALAEARTMDRFHIEVEIETGGPGKSVYQIRKDAQKALVHQKLFREGVLVEDHKTLILGDFYYLFSNRFPLDEKNSHFSVKLDQFNERDTDNRLRVIKPGLVGLSAAMANFEDVRTALGLSRADAFKLVERSQSNGNSVSVIKSPNGFTYEVEDSTLRLLKVTMEYQGEGGYFLKNELSSSYSGDKTFPDKCVIVRAENNLPPRETKISLRFLPLNFNNSDFELDSLEMPLGTVCTDYRINKIIGYWNGTEFIENFYESILTQPEVPPSFPYINIAIALLVLLLATLTVIYLKKIARE